MRLLDAPRKTSRGTRFFLAKNHLCKNIVAQIS